jgi:large subunit ribosomal protein L24
MNTKLKIGDKVEVTKGKDTRKMGKVEKIFTDKGRILVENINLVKKHMKARGKQQGGIITVNKPLSIANVQLVCPTCHKRTKVGYQMTGKEKQRICKECKAVITNENKKK